MRRGQLRIYLGAAPGVGKTYAMLAEGHRRRDRGTDVVVGFVETYGRKLTARLAEGLETIPRRLMTYRGASFEEMDIDALLARHPEVALVDELAHTNVPGSRNAKRWQDVEELLDSGITVISTVNIQHLESLHDVVEKITGVPQRETIPDAVVRAADQIEVVDMAPEALRRRMEHGNVYPREKIDAALSNYFRVGNLTALREIALLWVADRVEEGLLKYRADHGIKQTWEARERVIVALTGGPEGDALIRRAARIAARTVGGDLLAVHVARSDGLTGASPATLEAQRRLVESLGGTYHQITGDDVPETLLDFARGENATQLVLGASRRSWLATVFTGPGIGARTIHGSGDIDVHIVTHAQMGRRGGLPRPRGGLSRRRRIYGFAVTAVLAPVLTVLLAMDRGRISLLSDALTYLVLVVAVALVGGIYPAVAAAVVTSLLLNFYFIPPLHTFTVTGTNNVLALSAFVVVAVAVSSVVDLAARRTRQAARASAESQTLATLASSVLHGEDSVDAVLERAREMFGATSVSLLQRSDGAVGSVPRGPAGAWTVAASAGQGPPARPEDADVGVDAGDDYCLALRGRDLSTEDRRVLGAFAAQAAALLEHHRLAVAAEAGKPAAETSRSRAALLATVGRDLGGPIATATAAVSSLRAPDAAWTASETAGLLATAAKSLGQLTRLTGNLLDMSRLQAGTLPIRPQPADVADTIVQAVASVGPQAAEVTMATPEGLPRVIADPALLERVLASLLSSAIRCSRAGMTPAVTASTLDDRIEIRVIDHGPVGAGFVRSDVELSLALARGLVEAMHGTLTPAETPGGGLTMTVSLPTATAHSNDALIETPVGSRSIDRSPSSAGTSTGAVEA